MVRGEADKKTSNIEASSRVAPNLEKYVRCCSVKIEQKWAIQKPRLDNAKRLRGIYFTDPEDEELKETQKNACRKLAILMEAATPCNISRSKHKENCRSTDNRKTKFACIVDANDSRRRRLEGLYPKIMKTILQEKELTLWTIAVLFTCPKQ